MQNQALNLAEQLSGVLSGSVCLESLLAGAADFGGPMKQCFHGLQHFLADADLRNEDASYRAMQETEMRKLIEVLRSGADEARLKRITFLGTSRE